MPLVPPRFLFRLAHPCLLVEDLPSEQGDNLIDLPEACRLDNFPGPDERLNFAEVRLAWNPLGIGIQVEVRGKNQPPQGDANRPRGSDGVTLWLDTRDARAGHRATRYCHQFHLLPSGGGPYLEEPIVTQSKIHRALQDAPLAGPGAIPFQAAAIKGGYRVEAFLPAAVLHGFDAEQNPRLGVFYAVRDAELGEQTLGVNSDFPYWEDPSLWSVLEL